MKNIIIQCALPISIAAAVLDCSGVASSAPVGNTVVLEGVAFRGGPNTVVTTARDPSGESVAIDGADAVIDLRDVSENASSKEVAKPALTSCAFVMQAVDRGAHRVRLSFGGIGVVDLTEGETDAWLLPSFAGATHYGAQVFRKGKLVTTLTGQTKTLTVADFDAVHAGQLESLEFELAYGKVSKDAWSVTLSHGDVTIVLTPEGAPKTLTDGPAEIGVQTTGVTDGFLLTRRTVTFGSP